MTTREGRFDNIPTSGDQNFNNYAGDKLNSKTVKRFNDVTQATVIKTISGESVSFSAGAAGTTGTVMLTYSPIYDADGANLGYIDDTSFAWVTGTVLTTEVEYKSKISDTVQLAALAQGEYAIDYDSGKVLYCKATTGTSDTCNYKYRTQEVNIAVGDIEIGAVEIKDGTTDARQAVKVDNATAGATPTVALTGGIYKNSFDTYDDNDAAPLHTDASGQLVVNPLGLQATVVDDSAMPATPNILPIGGEYRASATTYTDGDATVLQTAVDGSLRTNSFVIPPYTHSSGRGDFTATYTSNVTITLAGAPATVANKNIVGICVNTSAGTNRRIFINGVGGISMSVSSNVITITNAGTPFAASDTYDVMLNLFDKATDTDLDARKTIRQNMEVDQYVEESIVDTTNVATGTYFPSADGIAVGRYNNFSATGKLIDGAGETTTLTIEVTNDEDATTGNRDWQAIYVYDMINNAVVNSVAANNTTTYFALGLDKLNVKYIRYKIVTSASTNTVIIKQKKTAVM